MIKRKIIKKLENWKSKGQGKAFILDGARQTGKTYILDWFCRSNFSSYLYVTLTNDISYKILKSCGCIDDFLRVISLLSDKKTLDKGTVIFIDDVERIPNLITLIKLLVIDSTYRYVLSGSLLGLELINIDSIPVGYAEYHILYPIDFEEFLIASKVNEETIKYVVNCIKDKIEISYPLYLTLSNLFNTYLTIGGMPSIVDKYLLEEDYNKIFKIQDKIIDIYNEDFYGYEEHNKKLELRRLYKNIPIQLEKEYNRFYVKEYDIKSRYSKIGYSLDYLTSSYCVHKINLVNDLRDRLSYSKRESFKLYLNDVGLLRRMKGDKCQSNLVYDKETSWLYENFICQELIAHGQEVYYYKSKKVGEVQFVYQDKQTKYIVPIVVSVDKDYSAHRSIDYLLDTYPEIEYGIVLGNTNVKLVSKVLYLPVWAFGLIPPISYPEFDRVAINDIKLDLEILRSLRKDKLD